MWEKCNDRAALNHQRFAMISLEAGVAFIRARRSVDAMQYTTRYRISILRTNLDALIAFPAIQTRLSQLIRFTLEWPAVEAGIRLITQFGVRSRPRSRLPEIDILRKLFVSTFTAAPAQEFFLPSTRRAGSH